MNAVQAIGLIARREIRSRILAKPFLIGLLVMIGLIFAVFGLTSALDPDGSLDVGLVGVQSEGAVEAMEVLADLDQTELSFSRPPDRAAAEADLLSGELDVVVVDDAELLFDRLDPAVVSLLSPALQQATLVRELRAAGLSAESVRDALDAAGGLQLTELDPDPDRAVRENVAFVSVVLLFISVQVAGAYILMGVFEEKSTKVVEIILSSVRARYLLAGKILGVGVLGIIQVAALAGSALIGASVFGSSALPAISTTLLLSGLVWFVLGYLLYGAVFAAGASLAPRQEDAQSTLAPVSVLLMLSYFAAIFSATDPGSTFARVVSWVPISAPFAMPGRIASGDAAWWEVAGAFAVTGAAAAGVLLLAERIYVRSVIHTDRKLGWREAWSLRN